MHAFNIIKITQIRHKHSYTDSNAPEYVFVYEYVKKEDMRRYVRRHNDKINIIYVSLLQPDCCCCCYFFFFCFFLNLLLCWLSRGAVASFIYILYTHVRNWKWNIVVLLYCKKAYKLLNTTNILKSKSICMYECTIVVYNDECISFFVSSM